MNSFLTRTFVFLVPVLIILSLIITYNYVFDPYGVIRQDFSGVASLEPNQRCIKAKYILKKPTKYNSFLFGSSRVGYIDVSKLNTPTTKWYNMTYSEGVPSEHLHDIKFLLKNDVTINTIAIGVDNVSFSVDPSRHLGEAPRKPYVNEMYPLIDYLLLQPKYSFYQKVQFNKTNKLYVIFDIHNTGGTLLHGITELIEKNPKKHCEDKKFTEPNVMDYYYNRVDQTIAEIKEIIAICEKRNIKYTFFINPVHCTTYTKINLNNYFDFLKKLSAATSFYDFSGINSVTTDNYNYLETSHYRPHIGDQMIAIFAKEKPAHLDGFGQYVTSKNITSILEKKRTDIVSFQSKKQPF